MLHELEEIENRNPFTDKEDSWIQDFPFDFLEIGVAGEVEVISNEGKPNGIRQLTNVPFGLGPKIPFGNHNIEDAVLKPKRAFDYSYMRTFQRELERETDYSSLIHFEISKPSSGLEITRDVSTGRVTGFHEVSFAELDKNAKNSSSLLREPASYSDFVRGKTTFKPFKPGGIDSTTETDLDFTFEDEKLLVIPPGFDKGLFSEAAEDSQQDGSSKVVNIDDFLVDNRDWFKESREKENPSKNDQIEANLLNMQPLLTSLESEPIIDNLPDTLSFAHAEKASSVEKRKGILQDKKQWAVAVDTTIPFTNFHDLVPNMAMQYPFELDTFQKQAVYHLENSDSVFVAAHTSAGKTVVAEYAIALAAKHMTRAIYTSPIKALSNQKFRDFKNTFEDVGLLTGDVQIKPEASCLIMTTEILRSMLYRGADLIRDVEWVIFDEVHYINDAERGVVWEEVLIMLPEHVGLILLSATVPNTMELADWIGRTKRKEVFVISTLKRPVPLEYFLYFHKEIYKIVDHKRTFANDGYKKAFEAHAALKAKNKNTSNSKNSEQQQKNEWVNLIDFLKTKSLMPVVAFTFSRKKCEQHANSLTNIDLNSASEKSQVQIFIQASLSRLKGSDRELPQVLRTKDLLLRGIAVHHSGLLPIIKEMVEILFGKGLVKLLFATETFAMGVNMPARTVIFQGLRKPDGKNFRDLLPGEFTQMAGRAGRRGLDSVGVVILPVFDDFPDTGSLHQVMLGEGTKLESKFRLTYIMILNLLRVEELRVEDMMKRSFSEFTGQKEVPEQQKQLKEGWEKIQNMTRLECSICIDIEDYYQLANKYITNNYELQKTIIESTQGSKALIPGRVVVLNTNTLRNSLGIIVRVNSGSGIASMNVNQAQKRTISGQRTYTCMVLTSKNNFSNQGLDALPVTRLLIPSSNEASYSICEVDQSQITVISKIKLNNKVDAASLLDRPVQSELNALFQALLQTALQNTNGIDGINPVKDLNIKEIEFVEKYNQHVQDLKALQTSFQCTKCPDLLSHYGIVHNRRVIEEKVKDIEYRLSDRNLQLLPDYQQRLSVLQHQGFVDVNNTVKLKGRVACELNTCDELLVTELIFENVFTDLDAAEIVALLSCFVFQEKSENEPVLTDKLQKGKEKILQIAEHLAVVQRQYGLDISVEDYLKTLNFGLVEVVYEWARGMSFKQITDLTDVLEGSIVRCIVRLDETCRDVRNAARVIGDTTLFKKGEEASALIKRDIVFAASLYY